MPWPVSEVPRVLAGDSAARFVVVAGRGAGRELRLVDSGAGRVGATRRRLLDRSRSAADMVLDHAASQPLPADADAVLRDASARAAVLVAADSLGAAERILDLAVQYSTQRHQFGALTMHGAIGYTWEHDLHLFYKRAKLDEQLYGTPEAWNDRIADGLALLRYLGLRYLRLSYLVSPLLSSFQIAR